MRDSVYVETLVRSAGAGKAAEDVPVAVIAGCRVCVVRSVRIASNCTDEIVQNGSFFFFQAEDGIRDDLVTGVQTCAPSDLRIRKITGSILSEATHAARYFTDATGAALALWSQGVVICRARSGETSPPLGAKLDVDSGISGECLRSGRSKRCNDTLTDPLVDGTVCQELGIRSLAAVPLRGERGVVGILEVFSDRPYAFSDAHITVLKQLAQIAVTGRAQSAPLTSPPLLKTPVQAYIPPAPERAPALARMRLPNFQVASKLTFMSQKMKGEEGRPCR